MRIALVSDIHGNFVALECVLDELARERIDQIICLGDIAALGPQPREVIDRLRQLGCPVIMGNTDAWLLPSSPAASDTATLRAITQWCAGQISDADRAYLQALPPRLEIPLDHSRSLLCYHGSPRSFDDIIAATTPAKVVEDMLAGYNAAVMAGGHTHIQMVRRYKDAHIINVGSIGLPGVNAGSEELPDNRNVRWAEYGVLDLTDGRLSIDLRRTPLDMMAVLQAGRASGMPHLDWWLAKWDAGS
ncbi:MAG: metallophosphoesterase family protein [Ktedonobacteraceae bacterium]|nr:metallophosphoesterase family protein [Ktedonobacteraceae bacterium]